MNPPSSSPSPDPAPAQAAPRARAAAPAEAAPRVDRLTRARRPLLFALVALWTAALVASHVPQPKLPSLHVSDTKLHLAGFLALSSLLALTLRAYGCRRLDRSAIVLAVMPLYAAFDELTQPLFQRTAAWGDWLSDLAGAAAAVALLELLPALWHRRLPRQAVNP